MLDSVNSKIVQLKSLKALGFSALLSPPWMAPRGPQLSTALGCVSKRPIVRKDIFPDREVGQTYIHGPHFSLHKPGQVNPLIQASDDRLLLQSWRAR